MVCCWCMLVHWPIHEIIKIEICLCCSLFETACIKQPHFINICNFFFMKFYLSHQLGCSRQQCNAAHGRVTRELGSRGVGEGTRRRIAHTPGVQFLEWRALGTHRHMLLQACWCTTHCATLIITVTATAMATPSITLITIATATRSSH